MHCCALLSDQDSPFILSPVFVLVLAKSLCVVRKLCINLIKATQSVQLCFKCNPQKRHDAEQFPGARRASWFILSNVSSVGKQDEINLY